MLDIDLLYEPPILLQREMKTIHPHKNLHVNVQSSVTYNSQKVQTKQMSINWWMDKQIPYNGILFSN